MKKRIIKLGGVYVSGVSSVVGKPEAAGPMGEKFDYCDVSDTFGSPTWEKSESAMQKKAFDILLDKCDLEAEDFGVVFAGDLQNQCVGSSYGLLEFPIPYIGLYGACSTAAEGMMLAAMSVSAGHFDLAAVVTSSHYLAAERQYRSPTEYGAQRSPTAQWTVTGAGAFAVGRTGTVKITEACPGIVMDKGINDASNMGAAMAPAAASTLISYFEESGLSPSDFDGIFTGDLGYEGGSILCELLSSKGIDIRAVYNDCGVMIYDRIKQDKHAGGSGCGCSATVFAADIWKRLQCGVLKNVLLIGTGAMMSPSSIQQGLNIPAVAHLVRFEYGGK